MDARFLSHAISTTQQQRRTSVDRRHSAPYHLPTPPSTTKRSTFAPDSKSIAALQNSSSSASSGNGSSTTMPDCIYVPADSDVKDIWRNADAVCFDVDSTVTPIEGIDELAAFSGVGQQVAECTIKAMSGKDPSMTFRKALRQRLNIIRPSRQTLEAFIKQHPPLLTPGVKELVHELRRRDVDVYLVTGGFRPLVLPLADALGIPHENVYANRLKFYFDGEYAGFDEEELTSDSGGKGQVCGLLKKRNGYESLVMIGDGATDLEACPPADAFIGFGGNAVREKVKNESKWFVTSFDELVQELPRLSTEEEDEAEVDSDNIADTSDDVLQCCDEEEEEDSNSSPSE